MTTETKFAGRESVVYGRLSFNADTPIVELWQAIHPNLPAPSLRSQQQEIGKIVSRLNKKLTDADIKPGTARASYRLFFASKPC